MNKTSCIIIFFLLLYRLVIGQIAVGDSAIRFNLPDTNGNSISLDDFSGQIILLNFFATWCPPCQVEAPQLEDSIWQVYKDQGVTVIGLDFRESAYLVNEFVQELDLSYPIVLDTAGTVFREYGLSIFPSNVLLNREGLVTWVEEGFNIPRFVHLIDSLLSLTAIGPQIPSRIIDNFELIGTYPNPFNNTTRFFVRINMSAFLKLKLYDVNGREVFSARYFLQNGLHKLPVDFGDLASGIYIYSMQSGSLGKRGKIVLQK